MPVGLVAWREHFPAPYTGLWEVDPIFFTGHGDSTCHNDGTCACLAPSTVACTACGFHSLDKAVAPYWALSTVSSNERSVYLGVLSAHGLAHSSASSQHLRELGYVGFVVPVPVVK